MDSRDREFMGGGCWLKPRQERGGVGEQRGSLGGKGEIKLEQGVKSGGQEAEACPGAETPPVVGNVLPLAFCWLGCRKGEGGTRLGVHDEKEKVNFLHVWLTQQESNRGSAGEPLGFFPPRFGAWKKVARVQRYVRRKERRAGGNLVRD